MDSIPTNIGTLIRKAPLITSHTFTAPAKLKALIIKDTKTTHNPTPPSHTHIPFPDVPTMPTLRYDPKKYTYIDGSCISSKGDKLLGAAYYHAPTQLHTHVNPNGAGPTNTINKAELVAIHQALKTATPTHEDLHILTDSLSSIYQIHGYLLHPPMYLLYTHLPLLQAIAQTILLRAQAGGHTSRLGKSRHTLAL
jgi:hypothetical protein